MNLGLETYQQDRRAPKLVQATAVHCAYARIAEGTSVRAPKKPSIDGESHPAAVQTFQNPPHDRFSDGFGALENVSHDGRFLACVTADELARTNEKKPPVLVGIP